MFNSGDDWNVSSLLRAKVLEASRLLQKPPSAHPGISDWAGIGRSHISTHSAAQESWWNVSFIHELLFLHNFSIRK